MNHLILYGSLRRGLPAYQRLGLAQRLTFERPITLTGRLYDLGDHPGLVLEGADQVTGELHAVTDPSVLTTLDRYEGADYRRETVEVEGVPAFVYVFTGPVAGRPVVGSGDWLAYLEGR